MTSMRLLRQRLRTLETEAAAALTLADVAGDQGTSQAMELAVLAAQVADLAAHLETHEALKKHP